LARAREDIAALEERLSYAEKTILDLRAKLPTRLNQAAPAAVTAMLSFGRIPGRGDAVARCAARGVGGAREHT
jgi:hypothetical protein